MTRELDDPFEYDVAFSFAPEDREIAEQLASLLAAKQMTVFFDELGSAEAAVGDVVLHLAEVFRTRAYYCVLFLSRSYPLERWTEAERADAQEHALRDADEYFLLLRLDNTAVPGIEEAAGYRDLRQHSPESIADLLELKLSQAKSRSSSASRSHDLRSGNVPSKKADSSDRQASKGDLV